MIIVGRSARHVRDYVETLVEIPAHSVVTTPSTLRALTSRTPAQNVLVLDADTLDADLLAAVVHAELTRGITVRRVPS